jgi:hypothetical protein
MSLSIKEVNSRKELKEFVNFADRLYKGSEYHVPALHNDELKTLSKEKNVAFDFCKAKYWLALRDGQTVGRVAGIINYNYNKSRDSKHVRFGWLEFEDDEEVLNLLLETVEKWGREENMEQITGPLGFSSFDASGILVEGFDELPTSVGHYNYPYYPEYIENRGYLKDVDWVEFKVTMPNEMPEKIIKGSELVQKRYKLHQLEIKSKKDLVKYGDELLNVLNESYKGLFAFSELTEKQKEGLKKHFLPLLQRDYVSVVLDSDDKLVAFGISMPSLSKAFIKSKGKLFPFGYLRILRAAHKNDTVDLLLLGVKPEYQSRGVHAMIFDKVGNTFLKNGIKYMETTRELENNTKIKQLWSNYEYRQHKRARCYIKEL